MTPGFIVPSDTLTAPMMTTRTRPIFINTLTMEVGRAMVKPAFISLFSISLSAISKWWLSLFSLPRAFMTLIPEIFSRIILTTSSSFFCTEVYRGIPLREIKTTMAIIRGAMTARIIAMPLSMEKVTMKPPNKRIGALTPKVWELCMKDRIL